MSQNESVLIRLAAKTWLFKFLQTSRTQLPKAEIKDSIFHTHWRLCHSTKVKVKVPSAIRWVKIIFWIQWWDVATDASWDSLVVWVLNPTPWCWVWSIGSKILCSFCYDPTVELNPQPTGFGAETLTLYLQAG